MCGGVTTSGTPFHSVMMQTMPSFIHFARVTHGFAGGELLEVLGIHEIPEVAVLVEVLHFDVHYVGGFDGLARTIALLDGATAAQVAHLDAIESLALARFHVFVLDHGVRIAVDQ
jgi:hypothetical protein